MMRNLILAATLIMIPGLAASEPRSGIDTASIDASVPPQQDFWRFANGKWLAATPIPTDRAGWSTFTAVYDRTQGQLRELIEAVVPRESTMPERTKIADLYAAFMDETAVERAGLGSLQKELARIRGLSDKADLPALFARLTRLKVRIPFDLNVSPDQRDVTRYVLHLSQARLGLPDRDYFLRDDAHFQAIRTAYRDHIVRLLSLAGENATPATADAIIALETELARLQWTRVQNRDPLKTYNRREVTELAPLLGAGDWTAYLTATGAGPDVKTLIVSQPSYIDGLGGVLRAVPLPTWQAWLAYNLVSAYAPYLSASFVAEEFAFEQRTLRGVPEMLPRWKRAVAAVDRSLGFALGRLYVERMFPQASKARVEAMVAHILRAYRESIATLDWMGSETRREALAKLEAILPQIGYPAKARDYDGLAIRRDDLIGNILRARGFDSDYWMAKLGHEVDREEWFAAPQTVNAYYSATRNGIVFPAGILQPPFFDADADDAANYGAIGAVIGHEISHAFDDQGSRFDGAGNLRNWWTDDDRGRFDAKAKGLVAQYDAFSPLENYHVNGALTLGENVADNAGLAIATRAYRLSLSQCPPPVIDGFSGEQRLFLGFAQIWRDKMRDAARIERLKTDPHSPGQFRTNGTLRNQVAFVDAFAVKPGDAMYLAPEQRIALWQTGEVGCGEKGK
jgi:putative endopeptidase